MDCSLVPETFVTKFEIKGNHVHAKVRWINNGSDLFFIQVFSDDQSWSGNFSQKLAKSFEERLHENTVEYSGNVKDALKRNSDMFLYDFAQLDSNSSESKFCWKKRFSDSTAVLIHGFLTLQRDVPTESIDSIIDYLLHENEKLQTTIEGLTINNEQLSNELDKCKNEIENIVNIKESLESSLYGKFIQLLNSKKRRIQLLENHISTIEDDNM